jgi:hypothetical protein
MRHVLPFLAVLPLFIAAVPLRAQEGNLSLAFFVTVSDENVSEIEEAIRDHSDWHADQGDTWTWNVWEALGGENEYVYISGGHTWADLDTPHVDMAADQAEWEGNGARYSDTSEMQMWMDVPEFSRPPADQPAVAQVIEFSMNPGGEEAFAEAMNKLRAAFEAVQPDATYGVSQIVSGPEGRSGFVAIFGSAFADFDAMGPELPVILGQHYGEVEARVILEMISNAVTFRQQRIWAFRPDLSYAPM